MQNFLLRLACFMLINFGGLYLGAQLQGAGPSSDWYQSLNIAPWTPPGWVFGAAWSTIMVCFSICLTLLTAEMDWRPFSVIYFIQFVLNVAWNPVFFHYHQVAAALTVLIMLTIVVGVIAYKSFQLVPKASALMLPYIGWLGVAISLNIYVLVKN